MPAFILVALFWGISLSINFSAGYSVEKIKQGELLDKAKATTLEVFFESWMDRNLKKAAEGTWITLYKDDVFLYWGWATFESLTSTDPTIKEFYKTHLAEVLDKFPSYEKVHGNSIREKLEEIITKFIAKACTVTVTLGFKATLVEDTIEIEVPCSIKLEEEPRANKHEYYIILDKNNLKLIEIEEL